MRKIIIILSLILSHHWVFGQNSSAIKSYNAGLEYYNLRNYNAAIPFFEDAVKQDKSFVNAYRVLISCHEQLKNNKKAASLYETLIEVVPSDPTLPYNLALTYIDLKDYNKSVLYLKKALKIDPTYSKASSKLQEVENYLNQQNKPSVTSIESEEEDTEKKLYNKALKYYREEKYENTVQTLEGYYGDINLPDFYYLKAIALQQLGKREEAIEAYELALEVDDRHFNTNLNLGKIYYNDGNYNDAMPLLETAYERRPKDKKLLYALAKAQFNAKSYKVAIDNLEKYLDSDPKNGDAWVMLGNAYSKTGKSKNASKAFDMAKKYGSKDDEIQNNLQNSIAKYGRKASELAKNGNYQGAVEVLEQAIEEHSEEASLHFNLGLNYMEIGNYRKAREEFKKTIDLDGAHAKAYQALGLIYYEREEYTQAAAYYQATVDAGKSDEYVFYKLGSCHYKLKRMADAIAAYQKAIEKNNKIKQFYFGLGLAYIGERENKKSIDVLRKALAIDPSYLDAQYHICVNYIDMNRYDECIKEAEAILLKDGLYAKAYLAIAHSYKRKGEYIKAEQYQAKAVSLDPTLRD